MTITTRINEGAPAPLSQDTRLQLEHLLQKVGRREFRAILGLHVPGASDQIADALIAGAPATVEQAAQIAAALSGRNADDAGGENAGQPGAADKPTKPASSSASAARSAGDRLPLFHQDRRELARLRQLNPAAFRARMARHLPGVTVRQTDAIIDGAPISTAQSIQIAAALADAAADAIAKRGAIHRAAIARRVSQPKPSATKPVAKSPPPVDPYECVDAIRARARGFDPAADVRSLIGGV